VRRDGARYSERHRTSSHAHADATLAFVVSGGFRERQGSRLLGCRPASVLLRPAGVEHDDAFGDGASARFNVEIGSSFLDAPIEPRVEVGGGSAAWAAARLLSRFRRAFAGSRRG
jgi:hypothetical protein